MANEETCLFCGSHKNDHEGYKHEFSSSGNLKVAKPKEEPTTKEPFQRLMLSHANSQAGITMRLLEVLAKKGIVAKEEFGFIMGSANDPSGPSAASTP